MATDASHAAPARSSDATTVVPPTVLANVPLEVALHQPSRSFCRELAVILKPVAHLVDARSVLVCTTCQNSELDLLTCSMGVEGEKNRMLQIFETWVQQVIARVKALGYWADYFDPASGLLHGTDGNVVFSEVHCMQVLRGHRIHLAGNCHVAIHPVYGSHVYPASFLIAAPSHVAVQAILNQL
jgi:hypothetical protein